MFRTFTPLSLSFLLDTPSFNLSKYNFYTKKVGFLLFEGKFIPVFTWERKDYCRWFRRKLKTLSPLKKPYLDFWYRCKTVKLYLFFFFWGGGGGFSQRIAWKLEQVGPEFSNPMSILNIRSNRWQDDNFPLPLADFTYH